MEFVSWDDYSIPNIYGKSESHNPAMFQTTQQIILHSIILSFSDSHILWHILCGHGLCMDDQLKRQTCHVPSLIRTSWPHLAFGNCYRWSFYCAGSLTLVGSRKKTCRFHTYAAIQSMWIAVSTKFGFMAFGLWFWGNSWITQTRDVKHPMCSRL